MWKQHRNHANTGQIQKSFDLCSYERLGKDAISETGSVASVRLTGQSISGTANLSRLSRTTVSTQNSAKNKKKPL